MPKKKIAIILICAIICTALIIFAVTSLSIDNKPTAYIVIDIGVMVTIGLDADCKVSSIIAEGESIEGVISEADFVKLSDAQAVAYAVELLYDALNLESRSSIGLMALGYFSDDLKKTEDEVLALVPMQHQRLFFIQCATGKLNEREGFSIYSFVDENKQTSSVSPLKKTTPDVKVTPTPAPEPTVEPTPTPEPTAEPTSSET